MLGVQSTKTERRSTLAIESKHRRGNRGSTRFGSVAHLAWRSTAAFGSPRPSTRVGLRFESVPVGPAVHWWTSRLLSFVIQ